MRRTIKKYKLTRYEICVAIDALNAKRLNLKSRGENMPIALPQKKEQEKIAEILSEIDKLIISESFKLDFFQTHKNGLLLLTLIRLRLARP